MPPYDCPIGGTAYKRIQYYSSFQIKTIKDESVSELYPKAFRVAVDSHGEQMTLEELTQLLERTDRGMVFYWRP